MVRGEPSSADTALIEQLRRRGQAVSTAQLERWRSAGVLPANRRRYLGRGSGSASQCDGDALDLAEAMALVTRRGRSVHESALRLFTVDPRHDDLFAPAAAVPERGIRAALTWFIKVGDQSLNRRVERAIRRAGGNADTTIKIVTRLADDQFRASRTSAGRRPGSWSPYTQPPATRAAIADWVDLTIAAHLGVEEVGGNRLAEILADGVGVRLLGSEDALRGATQSLAQTFTSAELAGIGVPSPTKHLRIDQAIERLAATDIALIRHTRDQLACVAEMGLLFEGARGLELAAPMVTRMMEAGTSSIEAHLILYGAAAIATTLNEGAWHRMAALTIMVAVEDPDAFSEPLDRLAAAALPDR